MNNFMRRIQSANGGLMLLCLLGSPLMGISQIDFQLTKEYNAVFPDEGIIETADVDNDGDLDILSMGRTFNDGVIINSSRLLLNDGSGFFTEVQNTPFEASYAGDADFGDVDSDGDLDVIITGQYGLGGVRTGKLYLNQGNAVFTVADPNPIPALQDSEVEFFNFNEDEHLDILIAGSTGIIGALKLTKIFIGDGQGNFTEVPETGLESFSVVDASFGDIDGDGDEDLILSGQPNNTSDLGAKIYLKENGKYNFNKKLTSIYGGDAELADLDNDGDLDYLVTGGLSRAVAYFQNDGEGNFTAVADHPFIPGAFAPKIVVDDFDIDGDLDIFISGPNSTVLQNYLYINDGTGGFTINPFSFPVTPVLGSGVGNFDGKGLKDFLFFGVERQKAIIYFNNIDLNEPPIVSDIEVSGEALVNYELKGIYTFFDKEEGEDHSKFQWFRADDISGTNKAVIEGASLNEYLIGPLDKGKFLSLEISPNDGSLTGSITQSNWFGPIRVPVPEILVSGNTYPIINGSRETSIEDQTYFGGIRNGGKISKIFNLGNNGKANLTITDILLSGEKTEDFSVIGPEVLPIVPGASGSFTVEFSPSELGVQTAIVSISSNDVQNSPFTFQISAEGVNSPPIFGSIPVLEIQENFVGEVVDLNATDGEGNPADKNISYSISGGEDRDLFKIDQVTGSLSFISSPNYEDPEDRDVNNEYLIEITANDGEAVDNTAVKSIVVSVVNVDESPNAICKENFSVTLGADGMATIKGSDLDGGSSDDLEIREIKVEPDLFSCKDIGTVNVTLTVTDSKGQTAHCTTIITINDEIIPVISSVGPVEVRNTPGECGASITIVPPLVLDNCGSWEAIGTRSDNLALGDLFPIGETLITWKTDVNSMGEDVVQVIKVVDSEAPVIHAVEAIVKETDPGSYGAMITINEPLVSDCGEVILTGKRNDGFGLHEIFPEGETVITWTATDGKNDALPVEQKIFVQDVELPIIEVPQNISVVSRGGNCGSVVNIVPPKVTDNCGVSVPPVGIREDNLPLNDLFPVGATTIKWTAVDVNDNQAKVVYQTVNVAERQPDDIQITGPVGPKIIGTSIEMTAGFTDDNFVEAKWKISDGGVVIEESLDHYFSPETRKTSHIFGSLPAGVFTVSLDLKYDCGKVVSKNYEYVVIYDPSGGFVTGGGWIYSPAGAMRESGKLLKEGKANFGFNAKYKSGKNELDQVDGETSFQFKAGELYFKSSSHQSMSLVVSGGFKATYKGAGTLNGEEGYNFMVTVIDAGETQNYNTDLFRIKIWKGETLIYDNNLKNPAEDADPSTAIGGGSIVIHKPRPNNKTSSFETTQPAEIIGSDGIEIFSAYPNPMESSAVIEFSLSTPTSAILSIYDLNGREVQRLFEGKVDPGKIYEVEVLNNHLMAGTYIYRLTTGLGSTYQKQLMVK